MPIKDLLADTSFDADVTRLLGQAFDQACAELHDNGQPSVVKEVIAKRIIELASEGERDPVKLSKAALTSLGLPINRYAPSVGGHFRHFKPHARCRLRQLKKNGPAASRAIPVAELCC